MNQKLPTAPPPRGPSDEELIRRQVREWENEARAALILMTRLPIPTRAPIEAGVAARAMGFYPLAGLLVGTAAALVYILAYIVNLPLLVCSLLAVGASAALTGALHEDGLADLADGFGGGHTADDKLAIMTDSRTGTYGLIAVVIAVSLRAVGLSAISEPLDAAATLVAIHTASRAMIAGVAHLTPNARPEGFAASVGRPNRDTTAFAIGCGAAVVLLVLNLDAALLALGFGGFASFVLARIALKHIGGVTGDVLGAIQQVAEISMLLAILMLT